MKRLGELGSFAKGRGIKREDLSDEGLPCIRYGEIYTKYNDHTQNLVARISENIAKTALPIKFGDLLIAGSGETADEIGRCTVYIGKEEAFAGGDIVVFTPPTENSVFMGYIMNYSTIARQKSRLSQGDAVVHISANNLAKLQVHLPSTEEQNSIVSVLSDIDSEINSLEKRRDKVRAIKQGMMQQLLTGRIRLPLPTDPVDEEEVP